MARLGYGCISPAFFAASAISAFCAVGVAIFSIFMAHQTHVASGLAMTVWSLVISGALVALYATSALHSENKKLSISLAAALGVLVVVALLTVLPVAATEPHTGWTWERKPFAAIAFGMTTWAIIFAVPAAPSLYTRSYPKWPPALLIGILLGFLINHPW